MLARRVVAAAWRLERAERLEAQLFTENSLAGRSLGLALIRDCNGARSFDTLLRYRGGTLAELWRALRTLKALQAEAASRPHATRQAPAVMLPGPRADAGIAPEPPIEPETPGNPSEMAPTAPPDEPAAGQRDTDPAVRGAEHGGTGAVAYPRAPAPGKQPIEPEARRNLGGSALLPAVHEPVDGVPARRDVDAAERLSRARGRP